MMSLFSIEGTVLYWLLDLALTLVKYVKSSPILEGTGPLQMCWGQVMGGKKDGLSLQNLSKLSLGEPSLLGVPS